MIESDSERFCKMMMVMCVTYNREFKPELSNLYFDDLKEFSIEAVEQVAHTLRRRSKYFPAISEFLDELIMPAPVAWARAKKLLKRHGAFSMTFNGPDRAIGHTIESLGGSNKIDDLLRFGDTKDISIFGNQFMKTYEHYSRQQLSDIVVEGWGVAIYGQGRDTRELTTEIMPVSLISDGVLQLESSVDASIEKYDGVD